MHLTFLFILFVHSCFSVAQQPTLYIIGDSTVKNGQGNGANGLWGWGDFLPAHFDESQISIHNHALGGSSSRTFQTYGHWQKVMDQLKPGDYVIMQFGHNDGGPIADDFRARGTLKGLGNEQEQIFNPITKKEETVYTYGHYLQQILEDIQSREATGIICSPIPRNIWENGRIKISRDYSEWAKAVAEKTNTCFIDLNQKIAKGYNGLGENYVSQHFFNDTDHTHTLKAGAEYNAHVLSEGLREKQGLSLTSYLIATD